MARIRVCMEGLKYLNYILRLSYILQRIHMTMKNMVEKLIVAVIKMNPLKVSETRANRLKKLETELDKFFEIRSGQEAGEIETEISEAKTGTDN